MAPLHVASPGHLINMLSLPSSTTLMKGLNNTRAGTDPCRTALGPRSLTDTLNPVIKVSPTLGFPAYYEHVVESSTKSLTQLKRSSLFKDWATIVIKLLSIQTSKFVKVVLPEANCCYFALFPSSFPPKNPYCITSWSFFTKLPSVTCIKTQVPRTCWPVLCCPEFTCQQKTR